MSKKIKSKLYMKSKISVKLPLQEDDPQGFLFSDGKYRTKILPEDLPEQYLYGYLYKRYGFISAKVVKYLLYVPNYTFDNHLHKDDMLFILYGTEIEPGWTESGFSWYKGHDYVIDGSLILEFVDAAEKFSDYSGHAIRDELSKKTSVIYRAKCSALERDSNMSDKFNGFSPRTIDFMWNLRLNNEKAWFEAHKEIFLRDFQTPMKALGREVFEKITDRYADHGFIHKVSRIYKDARRVRGGEPYRCNLWFSIERPSEEWTSTPVFWFELSPENWSYGLGYYQAKPTTMAKLRARIDRDPKEFEKLISQLGKQAEFVLDGDEYVRKKEAPTVKTTTWYNKKSFSLIHSQPNSEELFSPELTDRIVGGYVFLMPFYDYFITLDSDPDPISSD